MLSNELIVQLESSFRECGYQSILVGNAASKPFRFTVFNMDEKIELIIYAWELRKGGGKGRSRTDEYKIQMTLRDWRAGLLFNHNTHTLVLGWSKDYQVWAGFDARYHQILTGRSNMVSIYGDALEKAENGQIGISTKKNGETAVAFPPYSLVWYAKNAEVLHGYALDPNAVNVIEELTESDQLPANTITEITPAERESITSTVIRPYRHYRFRHNILAAYENRCAISGMQLNLVEAAHIIPVTFPQSTDEIKNGICLSALYHKAYDMGLIGITPDYRVILNDNRITDLEKQFLGEGVDVLQQTMAPTLALPKNPGHHPSPEYLQEGMKLRGWL